MVEQVFLVQRIGFKVASITQIEAQLDTNADWFSESSVAKCKLWVTAATQLLHRPAESQQSGQGTSQRMRHELMVLREELKFARRWLKNNDVDDGQPHSGAVTGVDFTEFDRRGG